MSTPKPKSASPAPRPNGPKTVYLNTEAYEFGKVYAATCPKIKSISNLLERLLIRELRANAKGAGVKLPASLTQK